MDREHIEAYVDAAAAALDLPLRAGASARRAALLRAGRRRSPTLVMAVPLGARDEPAPAFTPIGPDDLPAADDERCAAMSPASSSPAPPPRSPRRCARSAVSASALVEASLARIAATDGARQRLHRRRRRARAASAPRSSTRGSPTATARAHALPLLGVPFAVKNLFDVAGLTTLAGSKIEREQPPAARRRRAGRAPARAPARCWSARSTWTSTPTASPPRTAHDGPTRNPHDLTRIAGGSSGGSGAAVAAGQVPLTLGSDTNGSIRVPASLCGVFGLKPTFGRLPRTGSYPFVASLDHLGPFARSARDLALAYDAMQGADRARPRLRAARASSRPRRRSTRGIDGPAHRRARRLLPRARRSPRRAPRSTRVAAGAGRAPQRSSCRWSSAARAAAFLITNAEGARAAPARPAHARRTTSSRCRATASSPARCCRPPGCVQAQRVRRWLRASASRELFERRRRPARAGDARAPRRRSAPSGSRSTASACRRGRAWAC